MKRISLIYRFITHYNLKEKVTVLYLSYLLSYAFFQVYFLPLKYYVGKYSFSSTEIDIDLQPYQKEISLLNKLQRYFPIKITCLMHAIAAHCFLKKQGIYAPINLGLNTTGEMSAHAWIGKNQHQDNFQKISL